MKVFMVCVVFECEKKHALTTTTHASVQAVGEIFTPTSCSPFFTTTYPLTHPSSCQPHTSLLK